MRIVVLLLLCLLAFPGSAQQRPLAFTGAQLYPIDGPPIASGTLLVQYGKILALGADVSLPGDAEVIDLAGRVVLPGLVDTHSHIGQVQRRVVVLQIANPRIVAKVEKLAKAIG